METNEGSLNLIFYGTGADAENLFNTILFMGEYWCDKIVCIVDGDPKKQGFKFHEHKIFAPHHIQDCKFDAIVILSLDAVSMGVCLKILQPTMSST